MEKFTFFWSGPFSQWYASDFEVDGRKFNCAEQFMMHKKAEFFGDVETAQKIMETSNPKTQKALGRQVEGFVKEKWDDVARGFVYIGNYHKFTQNPRLMKELINTKYTTLVEASPVDTIWGIGLSEDDPRSWNKETWRGSNWLGEVLTSLREDLINGKSKSV